MANCNLRVFKIVLNLYCLQRERINVIYYEYLQRRITCMARMRDKSKENCAQDTQNYIPPDNVYQCFTSRAYHSVEQRWFMGRALFQIVFLFFFLQRCFGK